MRVKLLDNGTGVIITRQPFITHEDEVIEFEGHPEKSVVIYERGVTQYYRKIRNGKAELPFAILDGVIKISVAVISASGVKWTCEEIIADVLENGGVLIAPNDMNLPQAVVDLKLENEALRKENAEIRRILKEFEDKLQGILEGYDLI